LPAIHSMIQRYVRPSEISTSASVVTAACYLGALISNLISPSIISQYGWQACFLYFAALPPLVWLPLWGLIFGKKGFGMQDDTQIIEILSDATGISGIQTIQQFDNQGSSDDVELKIKLTDVSSLDSKSFYEAPTTSSSSQSMDTEERMITLSPSPSSSSSTSSKSSTTVKNKVYVAKAKINSDNTVYDITPQSTYVRDDWTVDSTESDPLIKSVIGYSAENKEVSGIQKYEKINLEENENINGVGNENDNQEVLPLSYLLSSRPVWAIMAAQYGQSWGMIGLLSWLPTYYSERFHVPLDSLANFTVLPYFLQMIVGISAGLIADKLISSGVRTLTVRKSLQITGMLVPAGCLALCAYLPSLDATTAAAFITFGSAISAITVAAVSANHFDISPKNAGTIFGIGNTAGCIGR
jgi:Major Facilitator Superfamily